MRIIFQVNEFVVVVNETIHKQRETFKMKLLC